MTLLGQVVADATLDPYAKLNLGRRERRIAVGYRETPRMSIAECFFISGVIKLKECKIIEFHVCTKLCWMTRLMLMPGPV